MHALEVPDAFAGFGVQRYLAICEQVVADAVTTVKIESRRTGRN